MNEKESLFITNINSPYDRRSLVVTARFCGPQGLSLEGGMGGAPLPLQGRPTIYTNKL